MLISTINYMMSMNSTVNRMTTVAQQTMKAWSPDVHTADVEKLVKNHDATIQKQMINHFDRLSKYQPQVSQGYLFGVELANGTDTSVISAPTFLMHEFAESDLYIGDLYTQPQVIVDSIKKMKKSNKQTMSVIYTDSFGTWLTVLKPLFNEDGEMFAYYGIDFDASAYLSDEYQKMATIIGIFALLIVILWLYQSLTTAKLSEQQKLTNRLHENSMNEPLQAANPPSQEMTENTSFDNTTYSNSKKIQISNSKQQTMHIHSSIQLIIKLAKESHIMLLHAKTQVVQMKTEQVDSQISLQSITERSTVNSALISRLLQEVQTATDKAIQSFQADTLLTSEYIDNKEQMISSFREITSQTTSILNNIKEVEHSLEIISIANQQLSRIVGMSNESYSTPHLEDEIEQFNQIIQSTKLMSETIQMLEELTGFNQ